MADTQDIASDSIWSTQREPFQVPKRTASISADQALELLATVCPALIVMQSGTVLAANAMATWIVDKRSQDLLLNDIYEICARELQRPGAPVCCNDQFIEHKLTMYGRIDPGVMRLGHQQLRKLDTERQRCKLPSSCPSKMPDVPEKQRKWRYPLLLDFPGNREGGDSASTHQTEWLQFWVSDIRINPKQKIPSGQELYLVIFDPTNEATATAIAEAYPSVGQDVFPGRDKVAKGLTLSAEEFRQISDEMRSRLTILQRRRDVGFLIKQLRANARLTAAELARQIGVSRTYVGHWESGSRPLSDPYYIGRMLEVLNPSTSDRARFLSLLEVDLESITPVGGHDVAATLNRKLQELEQLDASIADLSSERTFRIEELRRLMRAYVARDAVLLQRTLAPLLSGEVEPQSRHKTS